ncbi:MAG TPA: ABC transporter permease [Caulobacteraceae bacterium]|nr:ABC transporter permease [Caulobacteraceae bacterium]
MNRLLRIAWREYLAYVRTPGFWLSILLLPVGISTYALAPMLMARSTPTAQVAVVDFSGRGLEAPVGAALAALRAGGRPQARLVAAPGGPFVDAAEATRTLRDYLRGSRELPGGGRLEAAAILRPAGDTVAVDFWSRNVADRSLENTVGLAVQTSLRRQALEKQGVSPEVLSSIDSLSPSVADFSPKAERGRVALKDRLPGIAGFAMGMLLWMVVLTGAGMLLNSVIEEKSSRILEVLLSSCSVPEIMGGKILGVAAVTGTVLAFWMTIAGTLVAIRSPVVAGEVLGILIAHGLWAYFILYFLGGYLMFATLYVCVGAFCESTREAQTLLGPMMILMSVPLIFMSQALTQPDAPLLRTLSWIPPFTPFMMAARAASDPPLWQVAATAIMMFAVTGLELWVAIPAFKSGALATGRFELKTFVASLARRGRD